MNCWATGGRQGLCRSQQNAARNDGGRLQAGGKRFSGFFAPAKRRRICTGAHGKKKRRGYHGFVFHTGSDVTLEDDLRRRDLTINAMAQGADGKLIDPHGGEKDIKARVLRHVSPAFAEDPVRVLRTARFAAMLADFSVAEETMALMKKITQTGEGDNLTVERVWRELARGIGESAPNKMIEALRECGLLKSSCRKLPLWKVWRSVWIIIPKAILIGMR